jgi:hypothetical protein
MPALDQRASVAADTHMATVVGEEACGGEDEDAEASASQGREVVHRQARSHQRTMASPQSTTAKPPAARKGP